MEKNYNLVEEIPNFSKIPLGKAEDLRTQKFGKLTPLYRIQGKKTTWCCQCDCGNITDVTATNLKSNHTISCGCEKHNIIPKNFIDLTNQKFGKLTVLYQIKSNKDGSAMWRCKCECGNECDVRGIYLRNNHTQSCGCLIKETASKTHLKDLTNQQFGRLTVLFRNGTSQNGNAVWHCKCKCGNECDITGDSLLKGTTKSCGCLAKELTSQRFLIDLTGQKFGKLTVLSRCLNTKKATKWHCKCDCGNECDVFGSNLVSGHTQSCGCLSNSYGETKIENILTFFNIPYIKEKTFNTCRFLDTNQLARFDFYVNNNYLIEYDGIQHFQEVGGWSSQEAVEKTKKHDKIKNEWCKNNNITLIRIPYTHFENLCIEDLLLETSQFIVN